MGVDPGAHLPGIEAFVEIIVDLDDRRVGAGTETLHLDQGEVAVRRGLAGRNAELLPGGGEHLVAAPEPARCRAAYLHQVPADAVLSRHQWQ